MVNSKINQDYYAGGLSIQKDGDGYIVTGNATGFLYFSTPNKIAAEYFVNDWKNNVKKMVTPSLHII